MAEQKKDFDKEIQYKDPAEMADDELEDVVGGVFVSSVSPEGITASPLPSRGNLKATADFLTPAGGAKQSGGLFRLLFRKGSRGGSKSSDNGSMWI